VSSEPPSQNSHTIENVGFKQMPSGVVGIIEMIVIYDTKNEN